LDLDSLLPLPFHASGVLTREKRRFLVVFSGAGLRVLDIDLKPGISSYHCGSICSEPGMLGTPAARKIGGSS
jgi:hypothetical protein